MPSSSTPYIIYTQPTIPLLALMKASIKMPASKSFTVAIWPLSKCLRSNFHVSLGEVVFLAADVWDVTQHPKGRGVVWHLTTEITELLAPGKNDWYQLNFGLPTWPFGAARLVTWHYVLFAGRRTLLQNECFRKNFPPWEINWKGYYRNHWTVTILSNWFPTVESSSVSIHFEAKFFCRRKEHYVTWLIWPLQMVTWASPIKCNRSFFSGC